MSAQRQRELLEALSRRPAQSGDDLGAALGLSRAAVWKHIRDLRAAGIDIDGAAGEGYHLAQAVDLIDIEAVRTALADALPGLAVDLVWETGSTNQDLVDALGSGRPPPFALLAERQLQGRGRRGRSWVSPLAGNLYLSLAWGFETGVAQLAGLSLALGIACARTLRDLGLSAIAVKWPNDLVVGTAKLGGLLVEVEGELQGPCRAVIGLGLNCRMPDGAARNIDQPWTDLHSFLGTGTPSRTRLAAALIRALADACRGFEQHGLAGTATDWQMFDALAGREVTLLLDERRIDGVAHGIDGFGRLLVDIDGNARPFASGDVSVRAR